MKALEDFNVSVTDPDGNPLDLIVMHLEVRVVFTPKKSSIRQTSEAKTIYAKVTSINNHKVNVQERNGAQYDLTVHKTAKGYGGTGYYRGLGPE